MSVRTFATSNLSSRSYAGSVPNPGVGEWVRHPAWLAMTAPTENEEKFVGLHAVWPDSNFLSLSAAGDYTVNWGDGVTENYNSGVQAYHEYDYSDADLANTNGPVTLQGTANTVTRTSHGFSNGQRVALYNIVTTTGINEGDVYYVINSTANTFQLATAPGGSAVDFTSDGSATLLPYKQAVVTVTPQAGQQLTALNLHLKHNKTSLQAYNSGFMDIAIAGANLTDLRVGVATPGSTAQSIRFAHLERFNLAQSDCRQLGYLLYNCYALKKVVGIASSTANAASMAVTFTDAGDLVTADGHGFRNGDTVIFTAITSTTGISVGTLYYVINATANTFQVSTTYGSSAVALTTDGSGTAVRGTSMGTMFNNCSSLTTVPLFNTAAVTNMSGMLASCSSLTSVPLFNTAAVTSMSSMFQNCYSLTSVPLFNTAAVTSMANMFNGCYSLTSVPLFNTAAVTSMSGMLASCSSLTTVPLFNTAAVTSMSSMFNACYSLTTVPLFNTAAVTSMATMFNACSSLTTVPLFNTASVTSMGSMFNACYSLTSVPLFNTASVTSMVNMFTNCRLLTTVPLFNTAAVTSMGSMFNGCSSLTTVPALSASSTTSSSSYTSMFSGCNNLSSIKMTGFKYSFSVADCKLSAAALDELYGNLATVSSQTITVSNNHGTDADTISIATGKGWSVTG